jgi:exopolyphosphatase/guanosine-5'-triphosphate,3'-diphosphate pyrophosphatase
MSANYAVIDIGTIKVKFFIASPSNSGLHEIYSSSVLTCFGCGMTENKGYVEEARLQDTINELKRCKRILKKYKVKKSRVVSTHALRRAKNRKVIVKKIKNETGFDVINISQKEEAELFFKAALRDFPKSSRYAVLDIGGGSVQILVGNPGKLDKIHMMQTGAQYLHEKFTNDPHNPKSFTRTEDIENMKKHIISQLLPLDKGLKAPVVYGSTNIIDLMKAVNVPLKSFEKSKTHPYKTYARYLNTFIEKITPLSYEKREEKYKFQRGYMWGVDKAFLNVTTISGYLNSPFIIPSNANIAKGILYLMTEKES